MNHVYQVPDIIDELFHAWVPTPRPELLPEHLREAAHEAFETLLHTQDGQLCDVILDRAALNAILAAAKRSGSDLLESWAERKVVAADMKTAVRCART